MLCRLNIRVPGALEYAEKNARICQHPIRVLPETREDYDQANCERDMAIYRKYMINQLEELIGNYGLIDILFLDWSYLGEFGKGRADCSSEELVALARQKQPQITINDRADLINVPGGYDFRTPEQLAQSAQRSPAA